MNDVYELFEEIGFSINEAKVYIALIEKNPINGYEVAKIANITRTMVYDILKRLVNKGVAEVINERGTKLYSPIPYKELFQKLKTDYNNRLEQMEGALDKIESDEQSENYVINIADHQAMVQEIRTLIGSAKKEIYLSLWEEEALLFVDELRKVSDQGVNIITFSFGKIPYDFGINYAYGIPSKELKKIWSRRRIIVVVDRERIVIGEGNDKIEEISVITSNTMLIELSIDQMILDIIHQKEMKTGTNLPDEITSIEQYTDAVKHFNELKNIDDDTLPKRADQD